MHRVKSIAKKILFAASLLFWAGSVHATDDPPITTVLQGNLNLVVNDPNVANRTIETIDNVYYSPLVSTIINPDNDKITNVVSLIVDETKIEKIKTDFTARVTVQIDYTLVNGSTGSIPSYQLEVSYTKAAGLKYNSRQTIKFDQCRKVKVTLINVTPAANYNWNIWAVINLENRMLRKRDYVFQYNDLVAPSHMAPDADADELSIYWDNSPRTANGKTHFDIEWTWVDVEALDSYKKPNPANNNNLDFDADLLFKNNSSRITIASNNAEFKIPMIYDGAGQLFYRIRPVQYKENGDVINGTWSANGFTGITYCARAEGQGHQENLNWQTTTSFAEDGKHKTVVQYFDGTLRGRQTVTRDNVSRVDANGETSSPKTVVAETFYDYQGRPSINILPAPTMNSVIKYTADFNKFEGTFVTPKDAFDVMPPNINACSYLTPKLDNTTGASQYYSANNPEKNLGFNKFIPEANGYPYTETRYTPDATGRIEAQGGVGPTFQLGKGNFGIDHDTKYFYGKPDQGELDALFGTEAGDATHYAKNMVRDANGQYSVSYVDMHGRTVATALAGVPPANLKKLDSYVEGQSLTKNLLSPANNKVEGRSIVSSTTLIVTKAGNHVFHYRLDPLSAEIAACNPDGQTFCYDCYYNLEIRITGGCNFSDVKTFNNLSFTNGSPVYDQNCNVLPNVIDETFTEYNLPEGEYNITKTLTVNKAAQDWYRENVYNAHNICKKLEDFYKDNYDIMKSESTCEITCTQCTAALGTYAQYRSAFLTQQGVNPATTVAYEDEIVKSYNDAKQHCEDICNGDTKGTLAAIRDAMLDDMTPDQGQYARLDFDLNGDNVINKGNTDADYNKNYGMYETNTTLPFNIFNIGNSVRPPSGRQVYPYKEPFDEKQQSFYSNNLGQPDTDASDAIITNNNYTPENFSGSFKTTWADALIQYHPEYCKLKKAEANLAESYKRDAVIENVDTWQDAVNAGYVYQSDGRGILDNDPFFTGVGAAYKATMAQYINTNFNRMVPANSTVPVTFWKLAWLTVFCQNNDQSSCALGAPTKPSNFLNLNNGCTGDWNYVWRIFRSLYLSEKERMVNQWLDEDNCVDYATLNTYHYERRFGKAEDYYNSTTYMQSIVDGAKGTGSANDPETTAGNELANQYLDNCESYKKVWITQLETCDQITARNIPASVTDYLFIDANGNYVKNPVVSEIIDGLKDVCVTGSDEDHSMGSSSIKPGTFHVPASFQEVLTTVFNKYSISISALCHQDIIDFPPPYDKQAPLSDEPILEKKDACVCTRIDELNKERIQNTDPSFPSGGNLSQYLKFRFNVDVSQSLIDSLVGGCTGTCNFWDPGFTVPAIFSCETPAKNCIECDEYNRLKAEFVNQPGAPAVFQNIIYENPVNDDQLNTNKAFAKFMNNKTGFNKTWAEYLQFDSICKAQIPPPIANSSTPTSCISTFQKEYLGRNVDIANSMVTNDDGSSVLVGYSNSYNTNYSNDGYIQKTDKNGNIIWAKTVGTPANEELNAIKKTADGGYVAIGRGDLYYPPAEANVASPQAIAASDVWMVRFDANGNVLWEKRYHDVSSAFTYCTANDVISTSDGGFAIAANNRNTAMVIKTDNSGNVQWAKTFNTDVNGFGRATGIEEDGQSLIILGFQMFYSSGSGSDAVLTKLNETDGSIIWSRAIDIEDVSYTTQKIEKTANGFSFNSSNDFNTKQQVITNTDFSGIPMSLTKISDATSGVKGGQTPTTDGGVFVAWSESVTGFVQLIKLNSDGLLQWAKNCTASSVAGITEVKQTTDGGYLVTGYSAAYKIVLIKTDANGNLINCSSSIASPNIFAVQDYNYSPNFIWGVINNVKLSWLSLATQNTVSPYTNQICSNICLPPSPAPSGPKLCGLTNMFPSVDIVDTCNAYLPTLALNKATEQYWQYVEQKNDEFDNTYLNKCLEAKDHEQFTVTAPVAEYHYTLYYYDQAGNLVKTVPPAGVQANFTPGFLDAVKTARANDQYLPVTHKLVTQYRYNALNQVMAQKSPDGGLSHFWYDELGRLVVSQNAKQFAQNKFSYTKYDPLGRITEVGECFKQAGAAMTQVISQDNTALGNWLTPSVNEPNKNITKTVYDDKYDPVCTQNYLCQQNLRNRVSYTYVQAVDDGSKPGEAPWESATFYTYDIHGNVDVLLQDYKTGMGALSGGNRYKKITYAYDLISGKVNEVAYQPGFADAFYHRYTYDAENKLTEVYTSKEYVYWKREAAYYYYRHGPLARTVLGDPLMEVQGIDYAYTLQGWLKGVNTTALQSGGTIGNGEDCGFNSAVDNLYVYNRLSPYPSSYVARNSISFMPSTFESNTPDNFVAYIDPTLAGCGGDGIAGDEINNPYNNAAFDMGQDGKTDAAGNPVQTTTTPLYGNNIRTTDAYGYSLNYFNGDYNRIDQTAANPFAALNMSIATGDANTPATAKELFNGNIGAMVVNIPKIGSAKVYGYNYDQLNRITNMFAFNGINSATNTFTPIALQDYKEAVTYDPNGNILTYKRNGVNGPVAGAPGGLNMDDLAYEYIPNTNKLKRVTDNPAYSGNYPDDIDNQTDAENYVYDEIGNLIQDKAEGIDNIEWNVYGKIAAIHKYKDNRNTDIFYTYDASGNRISKSVASHVHSGPTRVTTTYYVRDASGNVMSVYNSDYNSNNGQLTQTELHLYGSSRLGVYNVQVNVQTESRTFITMPVVTGGNAELFTFTTGNKFFELSNHLGNVLVTISDKRIVYDGNNDGIAEYYTADVITANDYYPFGMQMPGRKYQQGTSTYRYGFNSQEKSDEIAGEGNHTTALFGEYDTRLVRRWNLDPKPNIARSPYAMFSNNPIWFNDITLDTPRNAGNGQLGQRFDFKNDGSISAEQFEKNKKDFLNNLNQQINNSGRTYNGRKISLNTNDPLASVITVTFGLVNPDGSGTSSTNMAKNSMFVQQSDMVPGSNVATHEWLHTAGLMDRYYELYGRALTDNDNKSVVDNQRSGTVGMGVLPQGHDDEHNGTNMMASSGNQITQMQWGIVFNLQSTGVTEESLGSLGKVSFVYDYRFANNSNLMNNNRTAALNLLTGRLNRSTNNMAFSSTTAFNRIRGTYLSVPNQKQSGLLPAYLNSYIIHNRGGSIFGFDLSSGLTEQSERDKLSNTIKR